jgi:hypothetical protein
MRKTAICSVVMALLFCGPSLVRAQETNGASDQASSAKPPQLQKAIRPYRLDFSLNELEDGKKINSRHYSMNLTAGSGDEIRIGTRVPVTTSSNQWQYMDVGTKIWANLKEGGDDLQLEVRSEISNLDKVAGQDSNPALPPIVRQIQLRGNTLLVVGRPIVIGSVDDPNSNRQFQLEVTVTKLK